MLVKLPQGVSAADFVAAVKSGALFPKGALDYSGPGLTSPGESIEIWLTVDPGQYILVCWNSGHATSTAVHPLAVQGGRADDPVPNESPSRTGILDRTSRSRLSSLRGCP